jgi:two-component system response regulator GlrR
MKTLNAVAVATAADAAWLHSICTEAVRSGGVDLVPVLDPGEGSDALVMNLRRRTDAPFTATLLLVSSATVPWARTVVPKLATAAGPVVLLTRGLKPAEVRQLLAAGARDFIAAPHPREELSLRLWRLLSSAPPSPVVTPPVAARRHPRLAGLVGESPALVQQLDRVPALAGCGAGVLILGETGTGKELFAQALHYLSPRSMHPFVAVNCGALPAELVESELFGHLRGAFTSAHEAQKGLVVQAEGGSLFLDEVDSLPLPAQVKLLRFLQDKQFRSVGSTRPQQADVRVIAASNSDLWSLVTRGAFRADLYYRLNVLTLTLPPLRERPEDVMPLAEHFRVRYAHEFQRPVTGFAADARAEIARHRWPGNVRELQHAIERGVLLAPGAEVRGAHLGLPPSGDGGDAADAESFQAAKARMVEQFERGYIEDLLARHGGNITHAADAAVKNRRAFFELMKKHHIDSGRFRGAV